MASYRPLAGCELSLAGGATPLPLESYRPLAGGVRVVSLWLVLTKGKQNPSPCGGCELFQQ